MDFRKILHHTPSKLASRLFLATIIIGYIIFLVYLSMGLLQIPDYELGTDFFVAYAPQAQSFTGFGYLPSETYRGPLYSLLISLVHQFTGWDYLFVGKIIMLATALGSLGLIFYLAGKVIKSTNIRIITVALIAINPLFIYLTVQPNSDMPFLFVALLIAAQIYYIYYTKASYFSYLILGCIIGFAFLIRYNGMLLIPLLICVEIIKAYQERANHRFIFYRAILLITGFLAVTSLYLNLNIARYGTPFVSEFAKAILYELIAAKENQAKYYAQIGDQPVGIANLITTYPLELVGLIIKNGFNLIKLIALEATILIAILLGKHKHLKKLFNKAGKLWPLLITIVVPALPALLITYRDKYFIGFIIVGIVFICTCLSKHPKVLALVIMILIIKSVGLNYNYIRNYNFISSPSYFGIIRQIVKSREPLSGQYLVSNAPFAGYYIGKTQSLVYFNSIDEVTDFVKPHSKFDYIFISNQDNSAIKGADIYALPEKFKNLKLILRKPPNLGPLEYALFAIKD